MSEEKSISSLYKMELNKGFFDAKMNYHATCPPTISDSSESPSEIMNVQDGTYNEWKTKNNIFEESQAGSCTADMVSNLGRTLGHWQHVIPKLPHCTVISDNKRLPFAPANRADQTLNMDTTPPGTSPKPFPKRFDPYRGFHALDTNSTPYHAHNHVYMPSVYYGDRNCQSDSINELYTSPLSRHQYDISKKNKKKMQSLKETCLDSTLMHNSYHQPNSCTPVIKPLLEEDIYHGRKHCYCNRNNFYYRVNEGNDLACNCSPVYAHAAEHKKNKKENRQISDLFRIVYLQNQQLELLQKQVQKLVELSVKEERQFTNTKEGATVVNKKFVKGTEKRTFNLSVIKENENLAGKVSVGIMTSFVENNIAKVSNDKELRDPSRNIKKSKSLSDVEEALSESSSEEIGISPVPKTSNDRSDDTNISFTFNEVIVPAVDNIPSPQTSFHLEMQDYKSSSSSSSESDSDSSSSDCDENSPAPVGWTFYDTVVGKVNDMLKISVDKEDNHIEEGDVRNATINQLRQLGVSFVDSDVPTTKRVTFNNRNVRGKLTSRQQLQCDSETSLHMNALAHKYLKSEKLPSTIGTCYGNDQSLPKINCENNLSHATLHYLERYQLSPNEDKDKKKQREKIRKQKKTKKESGKILDITAIKRQSKLLPKNT